MNKTHNAIYTLTSIINYMCFYETNWPKHSRLAKCTTIQYEVAADNNGNKVFCRADAFLLSRYLMLYSLTMVGTYGLATSAPLLIKHTAVEHVWCGNAFIATIILTRQTLLSTSSRRGSISFTSASFKQVCKLLFSHSSRHGTYR